MVIWMRKFICSHLQVLVLAQDMFVVFGVLYMVLSKLLVLCLCALSLWYGLLVSHLVSMILLYLFISPREHTLLRLCIHDMLITGDDAEHISHVKSQLGEQFQMSDLGRGLFLRTWFCILQRDIIFLSPNTYKTLLLILELLAIGRLKHLWIFTCSFTLLMVYSLRIHLDINILSAALLTSLLQDLILLMQ
jgi:hypothetical protein